MNNQKIRIKELICILILLLSFGTNAQELKRKASLGIAMAPMTDSIAIANNAEKGIGIHIPKVWSNSTASNLGMKNGAILTKINGHEINNIRMLISEIENLLADDKISMTYYQDGKSNTKQTKAIARPLEEFDQANIYYNQVDYDGNQLRSILYTPKDVKNPPVVYFLQGYVCETTEFANAPEFTIKKLINDWVLAGFAVYRVEKPGMGDSQCDKGCMDLDFNEEVEGFRQGYLSLQKNPLIDHENIFLFGHSMGGIVAPILANEFKPKGLITYGIIINTWFEYMQEMSRVHGELFSVPFAEIERDVRRSIPFWYDLLMTNKTNLEILENETIRGILEEEGILEDFKAGYFMDRHYTYWQTLNKISLIDTWLAVESNVLAIYGEYDIEALNANHVKTIAAVVNSTHPGKGSYQIIPKADHGFVHFESMEENIASHNSGEYGRRLRDSYHDGVAKSTVKWMNELIKN
ncbi:MAG: alpha/beta fold hydrolase [Crocinitomix sp.]|nr:alpha/beta fold hydrolase [Crocinitomix sp.]